jgi:23S rRNA (cytosine1962-C5)-methyltransferase
VSDGDLTARLDEALRARSHLFDARHEVAFRLFNGFIEGQPNLAADLYASTLLLHNYADPPAEGKKIVDEAIALYQKQLPWLKAGIVKTRNSADERERNGFLRFGDAPDRWVCEAGVRYAIDLTLNRDASFYLDTRNLRAWAMANVRGKDVLNTFAYTGSLGVAACAGGANRVVHLDLNRQFLNVAKTSYTLNGFPINKADFIVGDFWLAVNQLKRTGASFDCVFLDPPFYSATPRGVVDVAHNMPRLINKVRPLIRDGGALVAINNGLYVSGADYLRELEALCADGYLTVEALLPVPDDFIGYATTRSGAFITDPAPFNHPTKIAVLRVRRKA